MQRFSRESVADRQKERQTLLQIYDISMVKFGYYHDPINFTTIKSNESRLIEMLN